MTKILRIEPARRVDDDLREDGPTFLREYNVYTDDDAEINAFDVIDFDGRFRPGFHFSGVWKVSNIRLNDTASNSIYLLEVEFVHVDYKTPFQAAIDWEWESTTLDVPVFTDAKNRPLITTAGEPVTGLTRPLKLWILRGTRNVPGVPKWFRDYGVSTNSDIAKLDGETFAPKTLQLQRIGLGKYDSEFVGKTEYRFRPLTFEFWFNPRTWTTEILNMGFLEIVALKRTLPSGRTRYETHQVRTTLANGTETPNRVFLNEAGQRPRDQYGAIKTELDPDDIYTLKFDLLDELPYSKILK